MHETIRQHLSKIETDHNVRVLYAVESGSRAWGFASPDSDFDIRFIYVHHPNWYLSIRSHRDVIEAMIDPELDFAGWDLKKALSLLGKSNPSLIEWLHSPIVYKENQSFMAGFRDLAKRSLSLNHCLRHYLHTAEANWKDYFDQESVRLKKYLYVLRPIYACRWIERYHSAPPVAFSELLEGAGEPGAVAIELQELLKAKAVISELGIGPRRPILDSFIERELLRIREMKMVHHQIDDESLDAFFRANYNLFSTDV